MSKITKKCNQILFLISGILLAVFSIASFIFSRYSKSDTDPFYNSYPIYRLIDNPLINISVPLIFILITFLISTALRKILNENKIKIILLLISLAGALFSFLVLAGGIRTPGNDQAQVYSAASVINSGNYINLSPGGYVEMYIQQLGYITYLRLIFLIFGNFNFQAVQFINCLWIAGIIYMCGRCCRHLGTASSLQILGSMTMALFLPLHYLSPWVYGDIPFLYFLFLFLDSYFCYLKAHSKVSMLLLFLSGTFAVIFRKNALILLIACSVALLFSETKKAVIKILLSALILTIPIFATHIITSAYRNVSGYELKGGIPAACWISMGMNEEGKAGWFYDYSVKLYYKCNNDRELTKEYALADIRERSKYLIDNPGYSIGFYSRKLFTQWNDPFYNTANKIETDSQSEATGLSKYLLHGEKAMLRYLSSFQFMIYLFSLIYLVKEAKKKGVAENIIPVYLVGGFLFSILWEANSRYVLPYFLALFPMAAAEIHNFANALCTRLSFFALNRQGRTHQ